MNVLVACEESQRVCTAFREKGHNAFSCDIQDCSGGHPEWHIRGNVLKILNPWVGEHTEEDLRTFRHTYRYLGISFTTCDGKSHCFKGPWDLIIAHPPCTYLTVTGNRWFNVERYGDKAQKRISDREEAAKFFMCFAEANCPKIAIENPIGYMSTHYRKPDQIIQPYWFGEHARKATCLWLKGLPPSILRTLLIPETFTRAVFHLVLPLIGQEMKVGSPSRGTIHGQRKPEARPSGALREQWLTSGDEKG